MNKGRVLVVDDIRDMCLTLSGLLADAGYEVRTVASREKALQILGAEQFHVAILDVRLDETDESNREGLLLLHEIKRDYPSVASIILTGYADVKMVREALQPGPDGTSLAFGFLEKTEINRVAEYVDRAFALTKFKGALSIGDLIGQGEDDHVEFKSSIRWDYNARSANRSVQEAIAVAIAGMLNSKGGILLIGVADNGTVLGIEKDLETLSKRDQDGFQLVLTDIVRTYLGVEHLAQIHPHFELVNDKKICVLMIDKSPTPVFFTKGDDNKFWVRMGNSTRYLNVKAAMSYIKANWEKAI